jgi:hypothetical protein
VLTPGGVRFGSVSQGAKTDQTIDVAYAGRGDWKIKNVVNKSPNLAVEVVETRRNSTNVNYKLRVQIKDSAPVGEIREQLTLVTDDPSQPYIPLLVEGRVEAEYAVSPEIVSFGNLMPGERKTVNVVFRGKRPFSIEKIESAETGGVFQVRLPREARAVQIVPLTIIAPTEPGPVDEQFQVTIGEGDAKLSFRAHGKVVSTTTTSARGGGSRAGG